MRVTLLMLEACLCRHTKSQLHPNPAINRVLTVAERARLQSIPDHVPLEVCSPACSACTVPMSAHVYVCTLPTDRIAQPDKVFHGRIS